MLKNRRSATPTREGLGKGGGGGKKGTPDGKKLSTASLGSVGGGIGLIGDPHWSELAREVLVSSATEGEGGQPSSLDSNRLGAIVSLCEKTF